MTVVMGAIFFLSHQPGDSLQLPPLPGIDKIAHCLIYGALGAATLFAFNERWQADKKVTVVVMTVFFCLVYGISDEFHQSFVPGRTPSSLDVLADCSGAVIVCLLWLRLWGARRKR